MIKEFTIITISKFLIYLYLNLFLDFAALDKSGWTANWGYGRYADLTSSQCRSWAAGQYSVDSATSCYTWAPGYYIPSNFYLFLSILNK